MVVSVSKREQTLADVMLASWFEADRERAPRITVWDKSYQDHDPAFVDRDKVKRPPYVKYPYLHRLTGTQTTVIMDVTESAPRVAMAQPIAPGPLQRERAEAATEFCEVQFRQRSPDLHSSSFRSMRRVAHMGFKYGQAYFQPEWVESSRFWGIRLNSLSPYDVWEDARFGRFRFVRRIVTLAQLREIALGISQPIDGRTGELRDGGRAMEAFGLIRAAVESGIRPVPYVTNEASPYDHDRRVDTGRVAAGSGGNSQDATEGAIAPGDDPYNQQIVMLERHETCEDGSIIRIIPDPRDSFRPLVLQAERNPYGACQIVPFLPYFVDNEFYGLSNWEIAGLPAEAISYNLRASLAAIGAQGWPPVLKRRRANLRDSQVSSLYGRVVDVGDPSDLTYMQTTLGPSFHQVGMAISQGVADFATGEGPHDPAKVGQSRSATSAAIAEGYANLTDKNVGQQWTDTVVQVAQLMLSMGATHLTGPKALPILGRDTAAFVTIRPEHLEGPWHVMFGGNPRGANAQQQIALWNQTLTMFGASGTLDVRECAREVIRLQGNRDVQRFLAQKDEPPSFPPEWEEESLRVAGRMPEVSPKDDHRAHWGHHMPVWQQWQAAYGPQDPRVVNLGLHLVATEQQIAMQMAQPAMPQSGAMPMQPQDAGMPGQPKTFQPATAGVNEARQASNGAQPGQPPGPGAAPGRQMGEISHGGMARGAR